MLLGDEFLTVPKLTAENPRAIAGLTEQMNQLTGRVDREVSRVDQLIGALMEQQVIENFELVLDKAPPERSTSRLAATGHRETRASPR